MCEQTIIVVIWFKREEINWLDNKLCMNFIFWENSLFRCETSVKETSEFFFLHLSSNDWNIAEGWEEPWWVWLLYIVNQICVI